MLVLSRQKGERIHVGNDVIITVVRIGPNSVRLGIDAPTHMDIAREELLDPNTMKPESQSNGNIQAAGTVDHGSDVVGGRPERTVQGACIGRVPDGAADAEFNC